MNISRQWSESHYGCAQARRRLFYSRRSKLANNNQFNYPQNIYCRIGFVIQTRRRRDVIFLLHYVRPFSRRFVVVIAWFSVCCFTQPSFSVWVHGEQQCRCIHLYTSPRSALSLSHLLFYVLLPPLAWSYRLVCGRSGLCAKVASRA